MPYGYIYIIENDINDKLYVGQSIDISKRRNRHFQGNNQCPALHAAIRKHGKENFDFVLLKQCFSQEELNEQEIYWIKELNTLSPNGYNLKEGGEQGGSPSKETREKIRQSLLGFKHTDETKRKKSIAFQGVQHPLYGITCSEETKKKISEAQAGRKHWFYGQKHSEETLQKMRNSKLGKKNPMFGKVYSEEEKRQISLRSREAWRRRKEKYGNA